MPLIFLGLACLNAVALLATFTLGFFSEGRSALGPNPAVSQALTLFTYHLLGGLITTIFTLLVHSIAFTYFIGTGRWIQEVVTAYRLPVEMFERSRSLKRRSLPFVLGSALLVITVAITGAACDRGLLDATFHLTLAVGALAFNFWSYMYELRNIRANGALLDQIMTQVTRMRQQRGME